MGKHKIAKMLGVGSCTVARVKAAMEARHYMSPEVPDLSRLQDRRG